MKKLFLLFALMATALLSFGAVPEDQFTFVSHQDGSLIGLATLSTHQTLEYSIDGISWNNMTTETTISLNNGVSLYVRGKLTNNNSKWNHTQFTITGEVSAKGSIDYLWDFENLNAPLKVYCGYRLFFDCQGLVSPPELPSRNLATGCYRCMFQNCSNLREGPELPAMKMDTICYGGMFNGCSSLETAPALPATELEEVCYSGMFRECTSLVAAPALPATQLADSCYWCMFFGCTNLTDAPVLPATILTKGCYAGMFRGCTHLTTAPELLAITIAAGCYYNMFFDCFALTTAPKLPATTVKHRCYAGMFANCTSLTAAPELPATTLEDSCYISMFNGCSNLDVAPELPATILADGCYTSMFEGCTSLTKAPELPATILTDGCYAYMFKNCANLTSAPVLHADSLTMDCYKQIFWGCSRLDYIKCLATDISATYSTTQWVNNVAASGKFVMDKNMGDWTRGVNGIPANWTIDSIQPSTINFDANGGDISFGGLMDITPAQQISYLSPDQKNGYVIVNSGEKTFSQLRKDCPTREGHTFLGWFTTKTGGIQVYDEAGIYVEGDYWDEDGKWIGTEDLQLYAQWSVNSYTITWLQDDGSLIDKTVVPYGQINGKTYNTQGARVE